MRRFVPPALSLEHCNSPIPPPARPPPFPDLHVHGQTQVAALSQRRSEQANSSATASNAAPAKGPLLSPGVSSTVSDRSGASAGSDDSPDDRDKELTDPFDELQAFFAGAPLSDDGRNPAASSKVGGNTAVLR